MTMALRVLCIASVAHAQSSSNAVTWQGRGDQGSFVWADSQDSDFVSAGENPFLVRASGGVDSGPGAGRFSRSFQLGFMFDP